MQYRKILFAFILQAFIALPLQAKIVVYPAAEGAPVLKDFSVSVRQGNSGWKTIPVYATKVDQMKNTDHFLSMAPLYLMICLANQGGIIPAISRGFIPGYT